MPASKRRTDLEIWLENVIYRFDTRILPLDTGVMRTWGKLIGTLEPKGRVLPLLDSLIAAPALHHKLILVTRNESDFTGTSVTVLNIWE